jgi:hypothetical protein
VVITIILVLAGILIPVAHNAVIKARMTSAMNNAKQIYTVVFDQSLESDVNFFPQTKGERAYNNSTDVWKSMVTNEMLDVDFSFFGASGLPHYNGVDPEKFTAENNAWCVTGDLNLGSKNNAPLLFTSNLQITKLDDSNLKEMVADVNPFGFSGVVVAYKGGQARILKLDQLDEAFNPHMLENDVLRPSVQAEEFSMLRN